MSGSCTVEILILDLCDLYFKYLFLIPYFSLATWLHLQISLIWRKVRDVLVLYFPLIIFPLYLISYLEILFRSWRLLVLSVKYYFHRARYFVGFVNSGINHYWYYSVWYHITNSFVFKVNVWMWFTLLISYVL